MGIFRINRSLRWHSWAMTVLCLGCVLSVTAWLASAPSITNRPTANGRHPTLLFQAAEKSTNKNNNSEKNDGSFFRFGEKQPNKNKKRQQEDDDSSAGFFQNVFKRVGNRKEAKRAKQQAEVNKKLTAALDREATNSGMFASGGGFDAYSIASAFASFEPTVKKAREDMTSFRAAREPANTEEQKLEEIRRRAALEREKRSQARRTAIASTTAAATAQRPRKNSEEQEYKIPSTPSKFKAEKANKQQTKTTPKSKAEQFNKSTPETRGRSPPSPSPSLQPVSPRKPPKEEQQKREGDQGKSEELSEGDDNKRSNPFSAAQKFFTTVFEKRREEWIPVAPKTRISPGEIVPLTAAGLDLLLVASKDGSALHCIANSCPHLGTPLETGTLERLPIEASQSDQPMLPKRSSELRETDIASLLAQDGCEDCIVCPLHKTAFALESGEVRGEWCPYPPVIGKVVGIVKTKATLPVFDVRTRGKMIEVRLNTPFKA